MITREEVLAARVIISQAREWRKAGKVAGPWGPADIEWDDACAEKIDLALASLLSDEEDESELNHSYELGISSGLEQAANFLLERAAKNFKANHDETARVLRTLHHELLTKAAEARPNDRDGS